jgi:hypothetical protein
MSNTIIKLELVLSEVETNISKQYRLGQVGTLWLSWSSSGVEMGPEAKPCVTTCRSAG